MGPVVNAQQGGVNTFLKLSCPEKFWVVTHPFSSCKAWHLSVEARRVADSLVRVNALDGDGNGGQVDAFRHGYWMALLSSRIGWRKALWLGRAHERGNYRQYKRGIQEDGVLPDKPLGDMDRWNNRIGARLGRTCRHCAYDTLKQRVIHAITMGHMVVVLKDSTGRSLDEHGAVIADSLLFHQWNTPRVLVPSQ